MPYKHAHYFVGAVLLVIVGGFWASYFSIVSGPMPLAFHVHAVTSMAWLFLLIVQHIAIHGRHNALHKQLGKASFALFPLMILGFVMIINVSAERYAAQEGAFIAQLGPSFGIGMAVAIAAYLTLFYLALKNRSKVKLHAGYMLATPLILFESPFSRLMDAAFPWMNFLQSEGVRQVLDTIVISDGIAIIFALALYFMDRKNGAPWLVASFFMALQAVMMWNAEYIAPLRTGFAAYAAISPSLTMLVGIGLGVAVGWLGWRAGMPPARQSQALNA